MKQLSKHLQAAVSLALLTPAEAGCGLIMPVYGNNSAQYSAALSAAGRVPLIVVINPDDGPTWGTIGSIRSFTNAVKAKGAEVTGYINTYYGGLSYDEAEEQMDLYKNQYGVHGIFIDEMAVNRLSYYREIRSRAADRGLYLIGNPGTNVSSSHASIMRIIVTFENPYSRGWSSYQNVSWRGAFSDDKFGAIVYSTAGANMTASVDRALAQKYGWIYVTEQNEPDPFGKAPSYWNEEVNYVIRANLPPPVPANIFVVTSTTRSADGTWTLTFPSAPGRTYAIQTCTDLKTWIPATLPGTSGLAQTVAVGTSTSLRAAQTSGPPCAFFRVADVTP